MAKKSNSKKYLFLIAILCGVIALAMNFLPMLNYYADGILSGSYSKCSFSGIDMMFGAEKVAGEAYSAVGVKVEFSSSTKTVIFSLISSICTVVAIALVLLGKAVGKKNKAILNVAACLVFVAAAVFSVALVKNSFISANEINENVTKYYSLAIGSYLFCGFNALAGITSLVA